MMNMMSNTGFTGIGLGIFWLHLHWFFGAFALIGFILLTAWGLKHLSANNLKSAVTGLLTLGIVGSLLTAPLAAPTLYWVMGMWRGGYGLKSMDAPMMMNMMQMMMDHDEGMDGEEHEEHAEMQEMMRTMLQNPWHDQKGNVRSGMMGQ